MSVVKLLSVTGFRRVASGVIEPIFGISSVERRAGNEKVSFVCGDVPAQGNHVRVPGGGVSLYYGFRETLEETASCKQSIERLQDEDPGVFYGFHPAYINVEVGNIFREMIGLDDLKGLEFATIRRLKAEAQHYIMDRMSEIMSQETKDLKTIKRVKEIALYPHLFEQILSEPPFDALQVFVYPFQGASGIKYLAYVKPTAKVVSIEQNSQMPWEVVWPYKARG